eukprot:TRINITY_DN18611_c0_g1::TRINITY_DN18611_c0_g1_i1::g.1196::m.1196 TRINITY_DN18611_c0_g1::TRINITY_DN18611_c0_g1_i1::g.1196  ORF type:complete len:196 (-),score=21.79,sp/A5D8N2/DPCD_XENLA/50.79/8e-65,DPCD/PF14913.1/4.4e-69,HtaA/PF04213.8/2.3e+02,HtaA/PF04213.8/1.9 TRINITY_DN18611_c0_g1_i1:670-1257(-)
MTDPKGKTTCLVSGGVRKFHTTYPDGSEMVEEYDIKTDDLLVRKTKKKTALGREFPWVFEVGTPPPQVQVADSDLLMESNNNPVFMRKDMDDFFQWRIRNLPYPQHIYSINVDPADRKVVVRTSNKKYYKRFEIPDLDRLNLPLEESRIVWKHENNTLIIRYRKPNEVLQAEKMQKEERSKMKAEKDGDVECAQQ